MIWIILVQALTSLSVWAYFRKLPPEERSFWKTTVAAWIGFLAQILVLYLCYKYLSSLAAGDVSYVKELGQIGHGAASRSTSPGSASSACSSRASPSGLRPLPPLRATREVRAGPAGSSTRGELA